MAKLVSRNYKEGDEYEIVSLYNLITGLNRSVDQHRWEWLDTPEGRGSIWVIVESDSDRIIGHHGLIPIRLDVFGKSYLMGKTENTILHPKYSGTGIYFIYEKRFLYESKDRFDLLYTTSGRGTPGKIRKKLGYKVVGEYSEYIKVTKTDVLKSALDSLIEKRMSNRWLKLFSKGIVRVLCVPLMAWFEKGQKGNDNLDFTVFKRIDDISDEIDRFFERNRGKFGITIERTSKYLKWRIFENPYVEYTFLQARIKDEMVGYMITKIVPGNLKKVIIIDLVCENNNAGLFGTILNAAVKRFSEHGVNIFVFPTLSSKNAFNKVLLKSGFLAVRNILNAIKDMLNIKRHNEEPRLLIKIHSREIDKGKLLNPSYWFFTELFKEGVN